MPTDRDRTWSTSPVSTKDRGRRSYYHGESRDQDRYARPRSRSRSPRASNRSRSRDVERGRRRSSQSPLGIGGGRSRSPKRRSRSRSQSPPSKRRRHSDSRSRSRSRSRERTRHKDRKRRRERSESVSSVSSSGSERRRRRKKDKKRSKSKERERREKKERKREKREKKKKATGTGSGSHWGKYGTISETDIFSKSSEFHTWLVEERKINPETITKDQNKKEFARFMEDYNTATLPHEKFYNLDAYERRMSALRSGEYLPPTDTYDPDADLKALKSAHKKKPVDKDSYLSREQLMELRQVQNERVQAGKMKLLGMDIKQNMGVRMDTSFE